jgi:hypothetical protein
MPRKPQTNAGGLEATLKALRAAGRLTEADEALVALARSLAAAVDADPSNAALAREYGRALQALQNSGKGVADDDASAFVLSVSTAAVRAPLGDTTHAE